MRLPISKKWLNRNEYEIDLIDYGAVKIKEVYLEFDNETNQVSVVVDWYVEDWIISNCSLIFQPANIKNPNSGDELLDDSWVFWDIVPSKDTKIKLKGKLTRFLTGSIKRFVEGD